MSANAQESTLSAAAGVQPAPEVSIPDDKSEQTSAQTVGGDVSKVAEPNYRRWMALGYFLIILGTILIALMPTFRLSPGLVEAGVSLAAILLVNAGAALAVWAFVFPVLRRK